MSLFVSIKASFEMYAYCVDGSMGEDMKDDIVHKGHTYIVKGFSYEHPFEPFGVRLLDRNRNELKQTFFIQRFKFFEFYLN